MIRKQFIVYVFLSVILVSSLNKTVYGASDFRAGINDIVNQIVNSMETKNKKNLAVMDFKNLDHSVSKMGMYLSETLITKLFQTDKFEVIERSQLDQALKEIGLSQTGIIDSETTKQVGKILGVDSLVIGTITDLVDTVEINARLVSTETGKVFAVASSEIKKDKVVAKLLGQTIQIGSLIQSTPQYSEAKITLRSKPMALSDENIKKMILKRNYFDAEINPAGYFENDFEEKVLHGVDVVVDRTTGLMWKQETSDEKLKISFAKAYIAKLNRTQHAGFSDWRLPTIEELASLLNPEMNDDVYISKFFSSYRAFNDYGKCFSRVLSIDKTRSAPSKFGWGINFGQAETDTVLINRAKNYVRAVRSMK